MFGMWENGESGLNYTGQLRKQEILKIAHNLLNPAPPFQDKVYQSASIDLTVGAIFTRKGDRVQRVIHTTEPEGNSPLAPGEVALVVTRQEVSLPLNIVGSSLPVMSRSRDGILVLSHGHIDPGYKGYLVVRLLNIGSSVYPLQIGARIITLTFEQLPGKAEPYSGAYKDLPTVLDDTFQAVSHTVAGAVVDTKVIEATFRRLQRKARARRIADVTAAAGLGAAIVKLIEAFSPVIQQALNAMGK